MNGFKAEIANQSLLKSLFSGISAFTISFVASFFFHKKYLYFFSHKKKKNILVEKLVWNCVQNYKVVLSGEINKPFPSFPLSGWPSVKGSASILIESQTKHYRKEEKKLKKKTPKKTMILKLQTDFA